MARNRDPRKYIFTETMRDYRPDGNGQMVRKDSAEAYTFLSQRSSTDTGYTGSNRATVQSNSAVWKAYVAGGGDWHSRGRAAVDNALKAAFDEVQRLKQSAQDDCDKMEAQEKVYLGTYTELVQSYVTDIQQSRRLERNVARQFRELERLHTVRLESRSKAEANQEFYDWLHTQKNGIDPDDWARKRQKAIDKRQKDGDQAKKKRDAARRELSNLERQLKSSNTSQEEKEKLAAKAIEAKKREISGNAHMVELSVAKELRQKDYALAR